MSERQEKAVNRVLKKLTALRSTLTDDEQLLLDQIVTRTSTGRVEDDEVSGHAMTSGAISTGAASSGAISSGAQVLGAITYSELDQAYRLNY